jgi:DNA-directed RNA polymerase subunit K/omega
MIDIKTKVQRMDPNVIPRDIEEFKNGASTVYEALAIISKRSRQLVVDIKEELKGKLDEFEVVSDTIEEIHENKEQIEISKFYERLPNPAIIAAQEFLNNELEWREREPIQEEEQ